MSRFWTNSILGLLSFLFCLGMGAYLNNCTPTDSGIELEIRIPKKEEDLNQVSLVSSNEPYDVAIVGDGYFQVSDGTQTLYTRAGKFTRNTDGYIALAAEDKGYFLEPNVCIPENATKVIISLDGVVRYQLRGSNQIHHSGHFQLASFPNTQGLVHLGDGVFAESAESGFADVGAPGTKGRGQLRQGFLEQSYSEPVIPNITTKNNELNGQVNQAAN